jgi:hypothetical protein
MSIIAFISWYMDKRGLRLLTTEIRQCVKQEKTNTMKCHENFSSVVVVVVP